MTNREYLEKLIKEYREKLSDAETDIIDANLHNKMINFDDDTINDYINSEYDRADEWEILKNNFSFSELNELAKGQGIGSAVYDIFDNNLRSEIYIDDIKRLSGLYALSWMDDVCINVLTQEQIESIPDLCADTNVTNADDLYEEVIDDLVLESTKAYIIYCDDKKLLQSMISEFDDEIEVDKLSNDQIEEDVKELILDNFINEPVELLLFIDKHKKIINNELNTNELKK